MSMDDDVKADVVDEMREVGEFHVETYQGINDSEVIDNDLDGLVVLMVLPNLHGWRVPECRNWGSLSHQIHREHVAEAYDEADRPREIALVSLDWGTWQPIWTRDGHGPVAEKRGWERP